MKTEEALDGFIRDYHLNRKKEISIVTVSDLSQLESAGYSVEELLDCLSRKYQSLLHGSREDIPDYCLKPNQDGKVFGSDLASIALMRAIISNSGLHVPGLEYPYFIDEEHALEVRVHGINCQTVGNDGFVYILNEREGFENNPKGSWQYVKRGEVPIAAKIAVVRADFTYPIFDVTNNRRIQ